MLENENDKEFESKNISFNLPIGIKNAIDYHVKMGFYESLEHLFEEAFRNGIIRFKPLIDKKRTNGEIDGETYENLLQDIKRIAESENLV
jgi:hypothetical protein